jgi:VanZ family protein
MVPRLVVWWLVTLVWAAEIFYLSTATFGGSLSQSLLTQILATFHLSVSPYALDILDTSLRKSAHLIEYVVFSLLLYGSFGGRNRFRWRPRLACCCVLAAAAYALTDEFHRVFVPGRHASLIDWGIDATGAAIGMLLVYGGSRFSEAKRKKEMAL